MYLNLSVASSTNTGYDTTTNDTPTNICIRYQFLYITGLQFSRTRRHEKMIQKNNKKKNKKKKKKKKKNVTYMENAYCIVFLILLPIYFFLFVANMLY